MPFLCISKLPSFTLFFFFFNCISTATDSCTSLEKSAPPDSSHLLVDDLVMLSCFHATIINKGIFKISRKHLYKKILSFLGSNIYILLVIFLVSENIKYTSKLRSELKFSSGSIRYISWTINCIVQS
jgi:hypothetical protein